MTAPRTRYMAFGFVGGVAAGTLLWNRLQHASRRELFSRSVLRRVAALSYLRARPSVATAQLLKEYVAWEPQPMLRHRGARLLRRLEATL